jgi:hypothetical protein
MIKRLFIVFKNNPVIESSCLHGNGLFNPHTNETAGLHSLSTGESYHWKTNIENSTRSLRVIFD